MAEFEFTRATKSQQKARIALAGPSGSGKTWTALSIAQGLGQSIAVIDTERGSASKYASDFAFDACPMYTYDPRDLPKVLSAAAAGGYDAVIVDSLSHFWMGQGGMLEQVDNVTKRSPSGNSFGGWKEMRPVERAMIDALLAYPGHLIVTMRTKTEWVVGKNAQGRNEPQKIGTKPEQRDGIEYEFDVVADMDLQHTLIVSKSRISTFADEVIARPGPELGARIREWLTDGVKLPTVSDYLERLDAAVTAEQVRELYRAVFGRNLGAAPCMTAAGQPTTLIALITERGGMLGGQPATPAQQPEPQVQRAKSASADQDPWATEAPAPPTTDPERPAAQPPEANKTLLKAVNIEASKRVGSKDADRLALLSQLAGRTITSSGELTVDEARHVLGRLAEMPPVFAPQPDAAAGDGGQPEGWSAEAADQLAADFLAELESASTDRERVEIAGRIGAAVKARKITRGDRDTLLAAYEGARGQRKTTTQREPVGAAT